MKKKEEQLQSGFAVFMQSKAKQETSAPAQATRSDKQKPQQETFSKHNLFFSDALFEKVKILQARSGKTQREVLDAIIRQYVEDFEKKHGELVAENLDL